MECALGHGYPACASRKLIGIWANIGIFMLFARAFAVAICWRGVLQLTSLIAFGAMSHAVHAAVIDVQVLDRNGKPVSGIAVYVLPSGEPGDSASPGTSAVMDQVDVRFVPHLLVIQTGTSVSFPNTDTIAHHVYSFSNPNQFMLIEATIEGIGTLVHVVVAGEEPPSNLSGAQLPPVDSLRVR